MSFSSSLELNLEMYYRTSLFFSRGPIFGMSEENIFVHDRRMNWLEIRCTVHRLFYDVVANTQDV
jgi:hypothetical protein